MPEKGQKLSDATLTDACINPGIISTSIFTTQPSSEHSSSKVYGASCGMDSEATDDCVGGWFDYFLNMMDDRPMSPSV